jgi:hypothetical protein
VNTRELCTKAFALSTLIDVIKTELADTRQAAHEALGKMHSELGVSRIDVELPDGTVVATAALSKPTDRIEVTDRAAFLAWVLANHPEHLRVDTTFERGVVARLTDHDGTVVNADGEVVDWAAKVPARDVRPTLRITPTRASAGKPGGREVFVRAWHAGELAGLGLDELGGAQ